MKRVFLLIAGLSLFSPPSLAKTVNIEYILDASGSMLERIQNEMKIDIARETLSELVDQLPEGSAEIDLNVGLRVYGHSTIAGESPEQRCRDTVLEIPVKGVNTEGIKMKIAGINARGWTPIAYSLEQAADDFPVGRENDNIIILISDGKETCGGDPCAVAGELHQAGIKVKIHVVGFDIKPEEKAQLECIARTTGGKYFSADSAKELSLALTSAQEQVLKEESTSVRIKIGGLGTLKIEPAGWVLTPPRKILVLSAEDGSEVARVRTLDPMKLRPGNYRIVWDQWEHSSGDTVLGEVTVESGKTITFPVNTGINLVPAKWVPGGPKYWYLKDPKSGKKVLWVADRWEAVPAAAGKYDLYYRQWEHGCNEYLMKAGLEISPGKVTEVELNSGVGITPSDRWTLTDTETGDTLIEIRSEWGPLPVPPGRYGLSFQQTEHGHSLIELIPEFTIDKGQLVELEI